MADDGRNFEYRQIYVGFGESLQDYLVKRLQPWRWPIMLSTGAIRVEKGAKAVPHLTLEFKLRPGDVVVIDDAFGLTWSALMREARSNFRDYVFCPQRGRDTFLLDQVRALLMEKTAQDIPLMRGKVPIKDLYALIANLIPLADHPIRHLIIVTHATEEGELLIPMRPAKKKQKSTDPDDANAKYVTWESLQEAIGLKDKNPLFIHDHSHLVDKKQPPGARPQGKPVKVLPPWNADGTRENRFPKTLPRPERKDGKFVPFAIIVRGCSSGVHTIFLNKIRDALGYMVDIVVMPKLFDATARRGAEMVEYFQHDFEVTSQKPMTRPEIIQAFQAGKFRDWLGAPVPDSEWEQLVPKNVGYLKSAPVKPMSVRVQGRDATMKQTNKPDAASIRDFLIASLARTPVFDSGVGDWPIWLRMGLKNRQEFIDYYRYEVDPWGRSFPGHWVVHGRREYYRIRTPVLEKNVLVADYHPGREGAEPTRLIDYNDVRIFGRSDPTPKDKNLPRVGVNFSRLL